MRILLVFLTVFSMVIPHVNVTLAEIALQNGGFEQKPQSTATGNSITDSENVDYWETTATDNKIELGFLNSNGTNPHMVTNYTPKACYQGSQFIELAGDKEMTIFQEVETRVGDMYTYKIAHRARKEAGTKQESIMLTLGPSQGHVPSENSDGTNEPFLALRDWLKAQPATASNNTATREITVYTKKFNENGNFDGIADPFSYVADDEHNQRWAVYIISDDKNSWRDYIGTYIASSNKTFYAVSTYTYANGPTMGNLVDGCSFMSKSGNELLVNGGFESPEVSGHLNVNTADSSSPGKNVGWSTCNVTKKIEMVKDASPYIDVRQVYHTVRIPEGRQFAELNANETSSLYQYVETAPGKIYEWSLSHRGRTGIDAMALILGPRQSVDPDKPSSTGDDQMMRMVDWLQTQLDKDVGLDIINFEEEGCSKKIQFYTTKFSTTEKGKFENEDTISPYSWTKDENHTEMWNVWLIATSCGDWQNYGSSDLSPDYDYTYTIPEGQRESIFSFVSINSAFKTNGTQNLSVGNLIDAVSFKEYYRVECYTTPSGSGTYIYKDEHNFTYDVNYIGMVSKDDQFTVTAKEKTGEQNRAFLGAYINGGFVSVSEFTNNGDGTYSYTSPAIDRHYVVQLIFASRHVTYDSNGGDPYHYDINDPNTDYEVPMGTGEGYISEYTSHAATKSDNDGWRFIGWQHYSTQNVDPVLYKAEHTIRYVPGEAERVDDTLQIEQDGNVMYDNISANEGLTMIAKWKYRQAFIPMVYDRATDTYKENVIGGTIDVEISPTESVVEGEKYQEAGTAYFVDSNTKMQAIAIPKDGYDFMGWYDQGGNLLTSSQTYDYQVYNRDVNTFYALFKAHGFKLDVTKKVTGNGGDKEQYFEVTVNIKDAKAKQLCYVSGLDKQAGTKTNPDYIIMKDDGTCTQKFYIKHGQTLTIDNLTPNSSFKVTETSYASDGYTTTYTCHANENVNSQFIELTENHSVTITNNKEIAINNGINDTSLPFLIMVLFGILCILIMIRKRIRYGE